jgi:polar amino acid transport system permease protein
MSTQSTQQQDLDVAVGTAPTLDVGDAVRRKHPWRIVAVLVIAVLAAQLIQLFMTNERFGWGTVALYLFSDHVIAGLLMTLALTAVAMVLGIALGVILAICRISKNPILSGAAGAYIWFFRGTPLLVQLILFYNLSALLPQLSLGIPFGRSSTPSRPIPSSHPF